MALDGQRGPLRAAEADRHALPQRACRRSGEARLRHREDPCRRPLRDRRGVARGGRGVLDPARRDRSGDERTRTRQLRGQSAIGRAGGADDARRQARHRPRGIAGRLEETGRRSRARCPGAGRGGRREECRAGDARAGNGAGAERFAGNTGCGEPGCRRPGRRRQRSQGGVRSGCLGYGASLRARSRVRPRRSVRRRARPCAGHGHHGGGGTRGRGPGEGRDPARRRHPRRRGLARDREDGRRGTGDGCLDARRPGPWESPDAGLASAGAPQQGAADGRAEGRREADPVGGGPGGRRPGLCRQRQDHHARPGPGAGGEEGLPHDRPRAVRLGGADAGGRGRHRERNPATVPRPQRRRRRGPADE